MQLLVEVEHDAFAEPAHPAYGASDERVDRRIDAAQCEDAPDRIPDERLPDDAPRKCLHVDRDVG